MCKHIYIIWRFPEIGVPRIFHYKTSTFGVSKILETPLYIDMSIPTVVQLWCMHGSILFEMPTNTEPEHVGL